MTILFWINDFNTFRNINRKMSDVNWFELSSQKSKTHSTRWKYGYVVSVRLVGIVNFSINEEYKDPFSIVRIFESEENLLSLILNELCKMFVIRYSLELYIRPFCKHFFVCKIFRIFANFQFFANLWIFEKIKNFCEQIFFYEHLEFLQKWNFLRSNSKSIKIKAK